MKRLPVIVILLFSLFFVACSAKQPQISVEREWFDFGDVVNGEIVMRDLEVRNLGDIPLIVDAVSTSCGCTTATLEPMTLPPGDSATLHIEFDSGAHGPEQTGEFTRQIFIASNDPDHPEVRIEFTSNVLPNSSP